MLTKHFSAIIFKLQLLNLNLKRTRNKLKQLNTNESLVQTNFNET